MRRTGILTFFALLSLFTSGCFKSDGEKAMDRVKVFVENFNFNGPEPAALAMAQKASSVANHLTGDVELEVKVREKPLKSLATKRLSKTTLF